MIPSRLRLAGPLLLLLALGALPGAALPARAQETAPAAGGLESAVAGVRRGELVRVRIRSGAALEGEFAGFRGGALLLAGERDTVALAADTVSAAWVRRRQTRRGATIGGLIGGGLGLAFGAAVAALPVEGGQGEEEGASIIVGMTALGAGSGAALGGIVGAAGRGWRQLYPTDPGVRRAVPQLARQVGEPGTVLSPTPSDPAPRAGAPAAPAAEPARDVRSQRRFGSLDGALAYGQLNSWGGSSGGPGARVALLAEFRRGREGGTRTLFAVGPELELQSVGTIRVNDDSGNTIRFTAAGARLVARVGPETERLRAYALAGAGLHAWGTEERYPSGEPIDAIDSWWTHPSGVAGAGVQLRPGARPLSLGIEARQNFIVLSGDEFPGRYWTVAATVNTSL